MTNLLHSIIDCHIGVPLDSIWTRIDEDQLDLAEALPAPGRITT